MRLLNSLTLIIFLYYIVALTIAIPTSLIQQIKSTEGLHSTTTNNNNNKKVKRAQLDENFNKPSSIPIKRGTNLKNPLPDEQLLNDWEQEQQAYYQNPDNLANVPSSLFNTGNNLFDNSDIDGLNDNGKTLGDYEKGYYYGINKEKLDENQKNGILKSEFLGQPPALNTYQYYGNDERLNRERKRRNVSRQNRINELRLKRDIELSPEEVLTILTLYENERARQQQQQQNSRSSWHEDINSDNIDPTINNNNNEENWLDTPVYPHSINDIGPNYQIYNSDNSPSSHGWLNGRFNDRPKRFMIHKKRNNQNDPTRELRYLNGPNRNDFYTLSQLLRDQPEPNTPLYHRNIL